MAALMPSLLGADYRFRWHVKLRLREDSKQASARGVVEREHNVEVVGDTGLSVKNRAVAPVIM